jgi:hypothetical protein
MAQGVVHLFEAVEIEHEQSDDFTLRSALESLLQLIADRSSIGQASERIMQRQVPQLRLSGALHSDVPQCQREYAVVILSQHRSAHLDHRDGLILSRETDFDALCGSTAAYGRR